MNEDVWFCCDVKCSRRRHRLMHSIRPDTPDVLLIRGAGIFFPTGCEQSLCFLTESGRHAKIWVQRAANKFLTKRGRHAKDCVHPLRKCLHFRALCKALPHQHRQTNATLSTAMRKVTPRHVNARYAIPTTPQPPPSTTDRTQPHY